MYHDIFRLKISMNDARLIEIKNGIGKLPKNDGSFILFKKGVLPCILEKISL